MSGEPTTAEKLQALPWSVASNAFLAIFVQLTYFGSVFVLFLNELGLSKGQVGLVLSLIPFAGLLALFVAKLYIGRKKSVPVPAGAVAEPASGR